MLSYGLVLVGLLAMAPAAILLPKTPIMGFSTWNQFAGNIDEGLIQEVADALVRSGLRDLGYTFVNLDDVWAANQRNATGHIVADPQRFPSGAAALGQYLHTRGLRFGLYTARNNRTCTGKMPGSLGHEQLDAETFASYGADFIKNDDCGVVYANAYKDYGAMQAAIAAVARPMLHNVKAPDLGANVTRSVCQLRRVGKDLKNSWENMVRVLDTGLSDPFNELVRAGNGYFNDFDMLEVGNQPTAMGTGMTLSEQRAHMSLWAALKSPLVLGNDPRTMDNDTLAILSNHEVIAVNQDLLARPVRLVRRYAAPASKQQHNSSMKAVMRPCDDTDASQIWTYDHASSRIYSATGPSRCLAVYQCEQRWPWWVVAEPCAPLGAKVDRKRSDSKAPACSTAERQRWGLATNSSAATAIVWRPPPRGKAPSARCWGTPGSGCCLSVEGSNPEVDTCGWAADKRQQQWRWQPHPREMGAGLATGSTLRAVRPGDEAELCLSLAGDLEVYAGPLSPPPGASGRHAFTAVLFNRSPSAANITLSFQDLAAVDARAGLSAGGGESHRGASVSTYRVRDLWQHLDKGTYAGAYTALVPSHAVVHVNLEPITDA